MLFEKNENKQKEVVSWRLRERHRERDRKKKEFVSVQMLFPRSSFLNVRVHFRLQQLMSSENISSLSKNNEQSRHHHQRPV